MSDGTAVGCFVDSRDTEAREEELGPMRRDSFRDIPSPGPMRLVLAPGERGRDDLLAGFGRGLFVTSLVPHSGPGSVAFVAEVRGVWIEKGLTRRPASRTLLVVPTAEGLAASPNADRISSSTIRARRPERRPSCSKGCP